MKFRYQSNGTVGEVQLERQGEGYLATIGGETHRVQVLSAQPGELSLLFDGRPLRVSWAESAGKRWVSLNGCTFVLEKPAAYSAQRGGGRSAEAEVRAPMPAQVREVLVAAGEAVEKGQALMLLEAMKMEIRLAAPRAGVVTKVAVENGQTVQKDQVLIEIND
jgi:biotin carboxyl carrier protein